MCRGMRRGGGLRQIVQRLPSTGFGTLPRGLPVLVGILGFDLLCRTLAGDQTEIMAGRPRRDSLRPLTR